MPRNPRRHGYDDWPVMRDTRSEGGIEKEIDAKDSDGNGDDEASDGNQFRPEGLKTGEGRSCCTGLRRGKGQGAGAEREVPKEEGEENLVVRRGEKTRDVNRQNKKKNHDAEQSRSQAPL